MARRARRILRAHDDLGAASPDVKTPSRLRDVGGLGVGTFARVAGSRRHRSRRRLPELGKTSEVLGSSPQDLGKTSHVL